MNGIFKQQLRRWLLSFIAFLMLATNLPAHHWQDSNLGITWYPEHGYVLVGVRYWQDAPGGIEGFGDDGHATLSGLGNTISIKCNPQGGGLTISGNSGWWVDSDAHGKYVYFKLFPDDADLGRTHTINLSGHWWAKGSEKDKKDLNLNKSVHLDFKLSSLNSPSYSYVGPSKVRLTWKSDCNSNADNGSTYTIRKANGDVVATGISNSKDGSRDVDVDFDTSTEFRILRVFQKGKLDQSTGYVTVKTDPFPQVTGTPTIGWDKDQRRATVSFSLSAAPSGSTYDDRIKLQIFKKSNGQSDFASELKEIRYQGGQTQYSYTVDLPEVLNHVYKFKVGRNRVWGNSSWDTYMKTTPEKTFTYNHKYVASATSVLNSDRKTATVSWTLGGSDWSAGSELQIQRFINGAPDGEPIVLDKEKTEALSWKDMSLTTCEAYTYELKIQPGGRFTAHSPVKVTNRIIAEEIGQIVEVKSSKGFFPEFTQIKWKTQGAFDKFKISRRVYKPSGSAGDFVEIQQVDQNASESQLYVFEDKTCSPGIIYEYQVDGFVKCQEKNLQSTYDKNIYGFRMPTGTVSGRIMYKNGQGVDSVDMRLSSDAPISRGYSVKLNGTSSDYLVTDKVMPQSNNNYTFQIHVNPNSNSANGTLVKKGNYVLGLENGIPYFSVGSSKVRADKAITTGHFTSITGAFSTIDGVGPKLYLVVYGNEKNVYSISIAPSTVTSNNVEIGRNFSGYIDEVRIWDRGLTLEEIDKNHSRLLAGDEKGLVGYYRLNEPINGLFFDFSHSGDIYNENHGTLRGQAAYSQTVVPAATELAFSDITDEKGNYQILNVPYAGDGTTYTLTPYLGIHKFSYEGGEGSARFVIGTSTLAPEKNFTDISSFKVQGIIRYEASTIPVAGVQFTIDGKYAMNDVGGFIESDKEGKFSLEVPIGIHQVQAVKNLHNFKHEGKIVNSDGSNLDYQEHLSNLTLWDQTKVKLIGKVVGGPVQFGEPTGHSMCKNNLGDSISLQLILKDDKYDIVESGEQKKEFFKHLHRENGNQVTSTRKNVTILMNKKTGEYVAELIPTSYVVKSLFVSGYKELPNAAGQIIDLTNELSKKFILSDPMGTSGAPVDTVYYNHEYSYELKLQPKFSIKEVRIEKNEKDSVIYVDKGYLGNKSEYISAFDETGKSVRERIELYNNGVYQFGGLPVYKSKAQYDVLISAFTPYNYYDIEGVKVKVDNVPATDGEVQVINTLKNENQTLQLDGNGNVVYSFRPDNPDVENATGGKRYMQFNLSVGGTKYGEKKVEAFLLGSKGTGTDFTTKGPRRLLMVLRDPPGSNSYTYTSNTITLTQATTGTTSWAVDNNNVFKSLNGYSVEQSVGAPGAEVVTEVAKGEINVGGTVINNVSGQDELTSSSTLTVNTSFSTSSDPDFVGRDADVLIGNATNIILGTLNSLTFKPLTSLSAEQQQKIVAQNDKYALVTSKVISTEEKFGTVFAYPQVHIENVLIPQQDMLIKQLLEKGRGLNAAQAKQLADKERTGIYVPHLDSNDENYGKANPKGADYSESAGGFVGPYYDIYFPSKDMPNILSGKIDATDSLLSLQNSKESWIELLKENERQKIKAFENAPDENYSYQGGSSIEQSISYAATQLKSTTSSTQLGTGLISEISGTVTNIGASMEITQDLSNTETEVIASEETNETTVGFSLSDMGDDYMTVDVYKPNLNKKNTDKDIVKSDGYIFRLRGGATAGPYEGVQYTKYFEPGLHKLSEGSLLVEKPNIDVFPASVVNVPSNKPAVFTLKMYNESEAQRNGIFDLKLVDASNAKGAKFSIDGVALGSGRPFEVPYGDVLTKTLEVKRGAEDFDYKDMKLILVSQSQNDPFSNNGVIADTILLSAHFVPVSTDVRIKNPGKNWTLNVENDKNREGEHYMPVVIDGFDINDPKFERIELQYKPASEPKLWRVLHTFYKDGAVEELKDPKTEEFIGQKTELVADFYGEQDQRYDLRAVSFTKYGVGYVTYESEVASGIKDIHRPQPFGLPTPANGILNLGEDIRLTFNEDIAGGYLTDNNFQITAVKNGAPSDRSVSVKMDGVTDGIISEFGKDWSNRSLTVAGWVKFADLSKMQCIFALGEVNNGCSLKYLRDANRFVFASNDAAQSFNLECAANDPIQADQWCHVAAVVDYDVQKVYVYLNYVQIGVSNINSEYKCDGKIFLGSDQLGANKFEGAMDDFRVWDKAMEPSDIKMSTERILSGAEPSLIAYYPMDEARGQVVLDKARGNNAHLTGDWNTPEGYALSFDGKDDIAIINSGEIPVVRTQDYTLDFWFKTAGKITGNATLLCNGAADGSDHYGKLGMMLIGYENGELVVRSEDKEVATIPGIYDDQQWHHFLMTVNRIGGYAQVYMDEKMVHYFDCETLGDFMSAYLYLGARRHNVAGGDAAQSVTDQFFNGKIDEFRLWSNSFTQSSVENNGNRKMSGNEMGLKAYYPFDEWIVTDLNLRELIASDKDLVHPDKKLTYEGQMVNNNKADHAPLVDAGIEKPVAYEYVANKDALIINLTEPEERIDNTIVNIAVQRVLDVNGNEMDGVVRWSAFIDRNPIRWADAKKDVNVNQSESAEFTLALNNQSGVVKNFTLEGMPAWMEVSPEVGKIEPNSSVDIHFAVSAGANVGRYNEMIYARGDNNVAAALPLNVKVNGKKPDWNLDNNKYEHNMSIFGQLYFDGALSNDKEDLVAVFNNGECVGLGNSVYDKKRDMWYTYLTVYAEQLPNSGNDLKDAFEFRMWDASTGQLYAGKVNNLIFDNGICGSLTDLVKIYGEEIKIRDLNLNAGWNWVSFAVLPQTANSNSVLKHGVWAKDDVIKNASVFDSYSEASKTWEGTMGNAYDRTQMYMLRTVNAQSLNIEGTENAKAPIHVVGQKWNYMGYTPKFNASITEAMAGYKANEGDVLKSQTQFAMFTDGEWVGSLKYMEVNKGYMLYRKSADQVDFNYPSIRGSYSNKMHAPFTTFATTTAEHKYANNLTIVATPVYSELAEGDVIKAYVNGELRGYSQVVNRNDKQLHFLTISGKDEGENIVFSLERNGEEVAKSSTVVPFSSNATLGAVTKALEISFDETDDNVSVYPNPFVSHLNIQFFAEKDGEANISIYDLSGRLIMQKAISAHAGVNKYTWNGRTNQSAQCAGGVHIVRVTVDGKTTAHEVIKK